MKKVWLINKETIPHYRVPVYNYLSDFLARSGFGLTVLSGGVQPGSPHPVGFRLEELRLGFLPLARRLVRARPDAVIYWINFELYKFPFLFLAKLMGIKTIYWGHGRDLQDPDAAVKNFVYAFEHRINDALILYAEHLRKNIRPAFQSKIFVANNTLNLTGFDPTRVSAEEVRKKYALPAKRNIICMGRMQKRKRIDDLVRAFRRLDLPDVGLVLVGPDGEGVLRDIEGPNISKLGPVYGDESLRLLAASDVFCLPGAIGLGIVDAFYCGLPIVTEDVYHGPESMYLKSGVNGWIVPRGDVDQLADRLRQLLTDEALRKRFSLAARQEILTNGHIDRLCEGFKNALEHVLGR